MIVKLQRTAQNELYTRGEYLIEGRFIAHSLELPWRENRRNISCIPAGVYQCEWKKHSIRPVARIHGVPDRSGILIHVGNTVRDIRGCCLAGLVWLRHGALMDSVPAMIDLYRATEGQPFTLEVKDVLELSR